LKGAKIGKETGEFVGMAGKMEGWSSKETKFIS
jgi:hypothetical protein